mgnify:CR=1 FL=1
MVLHAGWLEILKSVLEKLKSVLEILKSVLDILKSVLDILKSVLEILKSVLEILKSVLEILKSVLDILKSVLFFSCSEYYLLCKIFWFRKDQHRDLFVKLCELDYNTKVSSLKFPKVYSFVRKKGQLWLWKCEEGGLFDWKVWICFWQGRIVSTQWISSRNSCLLVYVYHLYIIYQYKDRLNIKLITSHFCELYIFKNPIIILLFCYIYLIYGTTASSIA